MQDKISKIALYILMGIAIIVSAIYCLGANETATYNNEVYEAPANTDLLLYLVYAFVIIATVVCLASAIYTFIAIKFKNDKRSFWTSLIVTSVLAILSLITYAIGDDTPLNLIGYDGSENVGGYLKMADMCLYSIYTLVIVAAIATLLNPFAKKIG